MSTFGQQQEATDGYVKKLYTGVENFKVVAVCPTHDELKKIYGENAKEDTYTSVDDNGVPQCKIVLHLDNDAEEGEDKILTRLTFFVSKNNKTSQTNKDLFINIFGQNAWLPTDGTIPANMSWFDTNGARKAFDGEVNVISFLRNLLNLPSKENAKTPADAYSQFSEQDWNAMFGGNFSSLKTAVMSTSNKIGLLLGVKTTDDGKQYQDVYNRSTLRQYSKNSGKFDYLRKDVTSAQENGSYPNTDFGNPDYVLREYTGSQVTADNDSVFADTKSEETTSFFASSNADAMANS